MWGAFAPHYFKEHMLIKSSNRKEAYTAVINQALKDPRKYCNNCGLDYVQGAVCCHDPDIVNNMSVAKRIIKECREIKYHHKNEYASTTNKTMRACLKLPPFLYELLKRYDELHGNKFLASKEDITWFMRNFPQFCIPTKI